MIYSYSSIEGKEKTKMDKKHLTKFVSKEEAKGGKWYLLDASGKTLGRFASEVAKILRGKHKPDFTPNVDTGDYVIVVNANKIKVSGSKEAQKEYRHYTGYISGMRVTSYSTMLERHPDRIIEYAVKGMVPRNRLGRKQMKKLRIFANEKHNMEAQQPVAVNI